jgi:hypothetical protein
MQRLLGEAVWDADAVRDDVRGYVVDELGDPDGVLILDDTGVSKRGRPGQRDRRLTADRPGPSTVDRQARFWVGGAQRRVSRLVHFRDIDWRIEP